MRFYLADSVVVITGASSGMGKEITYRYAERGCKIVIGSRNIQELQNVRIKMSWECQILGIRSDE